MSSSMQGSDMGQMIGSNAGQMLSAKSHKEGQDQDVPGALEAMFGKLSSMKGLDCLDSICSAVSTINSSIDGAMSYIGKAFGQDLKGGLSSMGINVEGIVNEFTIPSETSIAEAVNIGTSLISDMGEMGQSGGVSDFGPEGLGNISPSVSSQSGSVAQDIGDDFGAQL